MSLSKPEKRKNVEDDIMPRKRAAVTFKTSWLKELIESETVESKVKKPVELGNIFSFSDSEGLICKICAEAKSNNDFAFGKFWNKGK